MSMVHHLKTPSIVAWLGYGGLLPFAFLSGLMLTHFADKEVWLEHLLQYGAVILSFVGALHWAFGMLLQQLSSTQRSQLFVWSVVPALAAWVALALPSSYTAGCLMVFFLLHYWQDVRLVKSSHLPTWYLPLRLKLTLGAVLSLAFGLGLSLT
jgi:hypothetical protein